ncbi:MAG: SDR family oxidoreductase [Candidatus Aminicenantales bacterium]|jgi:NAD(P)-dependent dehydrogenase (short-subunit alcohol dehydrogenase family)
MNQNICLITGATSGIGKAAALGLAKKNYRLILVGRNGTKAARVCEEVKQKSRNGNVGYDVCDLSVLRDARGLAARIKKDHPRIDVLINNAGARFLQHELTEEGIEMTLATNHLGHFVLTLSLIDTLKRSERARIINVSSGAHEAATGVIENVLSAKDYDGRKQYSNSKLANVQFTYTLAGMLKNTKITVNAVDPGGVATNFARNNGLAYWLKHRLYYLMKRQLLTPAEGAETIVYLASSDDVEGISGTFFKDMKEKKSSDMSHDRALQDKLWALSSGLSGIDL